MMTSIIGLIVIASAATYYWWPKDTDKKIVLQNKKEQALYMMGVLYANQLKTLALSLEEWKLVQAGISERFDPQISLSSGEFLVQGFIDGRNRERTSLLKYRGKTFKQEFLEQEGAKETDTGLAYRIILPGSDNKPNVNSRVRMDYHGTLTDGTVIGSTFNVKEPADVSINSLILGWVQGLQLIGEGGEIELVVPAELAYGDAGARPHIPGGATLKYRIVLHKVLL